MEHDDKLPGDNSSPASPHGSAKETSGKTVKAMVTLFESGTSAVPATSAGGSLVGPSSSDELKRDPAEVKRFWADVRAQLWIDDDELDDPPFIEAQNHGAEAEEIEEHNLALTAKTSAGLEAKKPSYIPDAEAPFGIDPVMGSLREYYSKKECDLAPTLTPEVTFPALGQQTEERIEDKPAKLVPVPRNPPHFGEAPLAETQASSPTPDDDLYDSESVYSEEDPRPISPPVAKGASRETDKPQPSADTRLPAPNPSHSLSIHRYHHLYEDPEDFEEISLHSEVMPPRPEQRSAGASKGQTSTLRDRRGVPLAPIITSTTGIHWQAKESQKTYNRFEFIDDDDEDDIDMPKPLALTKNKDDDSTASGSGANIDNKDKRVTMWPLLTLQPPDRAQTVVSHHGVARPDDFSSTRRRPTPIGSHYRTRALGQVEPEQHTTSPKNDETEQSEIRSRKEGGTTTATGGSKKTFSGMSWLKPSALRNTLSRAKSTIIRSSSTTPAASQASVDNLDPVPNTGSHHPNYSRPTAPAAVGARAAAAPSPSTTPTSIIDIDSASGGGGGGFPAPAHLCGGRTTPVPDIPPLPTGLMLYGPPRPLPEPPVAARQQQQQRQGGRGGRAASSGPATMPTTYRFSTGAGPGAAARGRSLSYRPHPQHQQPHGPRQLPARMPPPSYPPPPPPKTMGRAGSQAGPVSVPKSPEEMMEELDQYFADMGDEEE